MKFVERVNSLLSYPNLFRFQIYSLLTISYKTLLPNVNPEAGPFEIGFTINSKPVIDNVTEVEVLAIITNVSFDFILSITFNVFYNFSIFSFRL